MRVLWALICVGLMGISFADSPDKPDVPHATVQALMDKFRKVIPSDWTVSYEPEFRLISITQKDYTPSDFIAPNQSIEDNQRPPELRQFSFCLRFIPYVSKDEYQRLEAENKEKNKKLSALYDFLVKSNLIDRVSTKVGELRYTKVPRIPEEESKVKEYNLLRKTLHTLPDGYFQETTVAWDGYYPGYYGSFPRDQKLRQEIDDVHKIIVQVPSKY